MLIAILALLAYFWWQKRRGLQQRQHLEDSENGSQAILAPKVRMAAANPLVQEAALPPADLVKSVFADSTIPDGQGWAGRSSWAPEGKVLREQNVTALTSGASAPAPASEHHKGWALMQLWSAEPPPEVFPCPSLQCGSLLFYDLACGNLPEL